MKKRGFTIVELLVIISIIGLISSVALANLQGSREKAKIAAAQLFRGNMNSVLGAETAAAWNFNEGVVGNPVSIVTDNSGSNNNGTVVVPPGGAATYVEGVTSGSTGILLTGGAYINGSGISSAGGNPVTIAAWIKPLSSANVTNIFRVGVASCNSFMMGINSAVLMVANSSNEVSDSVSSGNPKKLLAQVLTPTIGPGTPVSINNSRWQFLTASFDSTGNVQTYIDGVLVSTISNLPTCQCCPSPFSSTTSSTVHL
jgi:prepilin-type N-terminal cleavage/methylation domain-containing protein